MTRVGRNKQPPVLPELRSLQRLRRSGTDLRDLVPAYVNNPGSVMFVNAGPFGQRPSWVGCTIVVIMATITPGRGTRNDPARNAGYRTVLSLYDHEEIRHQLISNGACLAELRGSSIRPYGKWAAYCGQRHRDVAGGQFACLPQSGGDATG